MLQVPPHLQLSQWLLQVPRALVLPLVMGALVLPPVSWVSLVIGALVLPLVSWVLELQLAIWVSPFIQVPGYPGLWRLSWGLEPLLVIWVSQYCLAPEFLRYCLALEFLRRGKAVGQPARGQLSKPWRETAAGLAQVCPRLLC